MNDRSLNHEIILTQRHATNFMAVQRIFSGIYRPALGNQSLKQCRALSTLEQPTGSKDEVVLGEFILPPNLKFKVGDPITVHVTSHKKEVPVVFIPERVWSCGRV